MGLAVLVDGESGEVKGLSDSRPIMVIVNTFFMVACSESSTEKTTSITRGIYENDQCFQELWRFD